MSWLVETLLLNREEIRVDPDFESDEYNNLLIVERKISALIEHGNIDPFEVAILNYVTTNKSYTELEELLNISRNTIALYFRNICDRISYALGSEFTDEGYLNYLKEKHDLEDDQVEKMRQHMNSRYRHTIRRKPHELK